MNIEEVKRAAVLSEKLDNLLWHFEEVTTGLARDEVRPRHKLFGRLSLNYGPDRRGEGVTIDAPLLLDVLVAQMNRVRAELRELGVELPAETMNRSES